MSIIFRNYTNTVGVGQDVTMTEPTDTVQGDVMLAAVFTDAYVGTTASLPSSWTSLTSGSSFSGTFKFH